MTVTQRPPIEHHEAWLPQEHPLHRPRHGGRQLVALISAGVFLLSPLLATALGARAAEFENRALAPFPGPSDGWGAFTGLPAWAADHLPFRDVAVRSADGISRGVFGEPAPLREGGGSPQGPAIGPVAPAPNAPDTPQLAAYPPVIEGTDGWLYLGADVRGACVPERPLGDTITALNRLRAVVESSGRRFELVIAPNKTTMVPEFLPDEYVGEDCARQARDEFWRRVPGETGAVDLRDPLRMVSERVDRPLYYPADTHWSHEGGLTMVYSLAERLSPGISGTWNVTPDGEINWPDDISPLLGRSSERLITTYSVAPGGQEERTRPVASDFREPLRLTSEPTTGTITTPVRMISDSFSQFASRYLGATFNDIAMVHPETVGANPERAGQLLAEGETVVVEIAERSLVSGETPILLQPVIDAIDAVLAAQPVN